MIEWFPGTNRLRQHQLVLFDEDRGTLAVIHQTNAQRYHCHPIQEPTVHEMATERGFILRDAMRHCEKVFGLGPCPVHRMPLFPEEHIRQALADFRSRQTLESAAQIPSLVAG